MGRSQSIYLPTSTVVAILLLVCSTSLSVQAAEPEGNEEVSFANGGVTLVGTLTLPSSSGRRGKAGRVVVMAQVWPNSTGGLRDVPSQKSGRSTPERFEEVGQVRRRVG